jgi:2-dehydro-3-deoxyphosphooctonate aldolase (KDO 8-P synthase)
MLIPVAEPTDAPRRRGFSPFDIARPGLHAPGVPFSDAQLWRRLSDRRRLFLIAGPCVIETEDLCLLVARKMKAACAKLGVAYVFKASFDKANRSSGKSFRGPGIMEGLEILARIRREVEVPVLTDVHTEVQAVAAGEVCDVLQIPAFLCRQTDLIQAAVSTGRIVNIKKGQFLAPGDMGNVVKKAVEGGGRRLLLTERGTTFGYNNLVADMRSVPILGRLGFPVVFDATHSVQLPGGQGDKSGGQREFAPVLARCALAAGANGLFIETHPDPDRAMSDGPNMIPLAEMPRLLGQLVKQHKLAQSL